MPPPNLDLARRLASTESTLSENARFEFDEVQLAFRNRGMLLEALDYDVTPTGMHYLLTHFDVPKIDAEKWRLDVGGLFAQKLTLSLAELQKLPQKTFTVTMECAGNGRALLIPRPVGQPWIYEGVSTARWTGVPLGELLSLAGLRPTAREIVFWGADNGIERGDVHTFARSLKVADAQRGEVLLALAMNGAPLEPQHGAPLRLIVPGWYGMASVKWIRRIEAVERPFEGHQQAHNYHYRQKPGEQGVPVTHIRVRALLQPPGAADFLTRARVVDAGRVRLSGRAWSGAGVPVSRVELGVNGDWREAALGAQVSGYAWRGWTCDWDAQPGEYELSCRATDANGAVQPLEQWWNRSGMGNNMVQKVAVLVM
jgi:sulfane dehydrogenase subunit SoxC